MASRTEHAARLHSGAAPAAAPGVIEAAARARSQSAVALLVLVALPPRASAWGLMRFVQGPRALQAVPGLNFAKILGSGFEGGFGLRPSFSRQGLWCAFDNLASAQAFAQHSPLLDAYRSKAREFALLGLQATQAKGRWSGHAFAPVAGGLADPQAPVVALTRASIRLRQALAFWRMQPPAEVQLQAAPGCRLAVGLGEAPLLRQATVSLWDNVAAMDAYARSGAHRAAIAAAYGGGFFSESMFVRFAPWRLEGQWRGQTLG
jgi:hypothetical protein